MWGVEREAWDVKVGNNSQKWILFGGWRIMVLDMNGFYCVTFKVMGVLFGCFASSSWHHLSYQKYVGSTYVKL